jgi:hypothetical protein
MISIAREPESIHLPEFRYLLVGAHCVLGEEDPKHDPEDLMHCIVLCSENRDGGAELQISVRPQLAGGLDKLSWLR